MPVPFSRTQRALDDDHDYVTFLQTPLISLLIIGVLYWLLNIQIAVYQSSESAIFRTPQLVTARFPASLLTYLETNPPALLYLDGIPEYERKPLAVRIVRIDSTLQDGLVELQLQIAEDSTTSATLRRVLTGVGDSSPAEDANAVDDGGNRCPCRGQTMMGV
ncbi:MAG: hypothetical protein R2932_05845 [Caldilineaceae bacterium]